MKFTTLGFTSWTFNRAPKPATSSFQTRERSFRYIRPQENNTPGDLHRTSSSECKHAMLLKICIKILSRIKGSDYSNKTMKSGNLYPSGKLKSLIRKLIKVNDVHFVHWSLLGIKYNKGPQRMIQSWRKLFWEYVNGEKILQKPQCL